MSVTAQHSVLLVDDERFFIASLLPVLQPLYTLYIAVNGQQALDRVREQRPDVVLLDIHLPDMDGFTVCKTIRAAPANSAIPIIFLSATVDADVKAKVDACGGNKLLHKPVKPDILRDTLAAVLAGASA